jgi:membrane protein required for colicin V production
MNIVDVGILAVVGLSGFLGLLRGAVREVMALGSLLLGVLVALYGYPDLAHPLGRWIDDPLLAQAAAFFAILLVFWIVFALIGWLLRRLLRFLRLGWADRIGGLVFGIARGAVLVSLLGWSFTAFRIQPRHWIESKTSAFILDAGDAIQAAFPPGFRRLYMEGVRSARSRLALAPPGAAPGTGSRE